MQLTVSIDDQLCERARAYAERRGTTLELLVAELLTDRVKQEFDRLARREEELRAQISGFSASDRLPREKLYDRKLFRSFDS